MDRWIHREIREDPLLEVDAASTSGEVSYSAVWEHDVSREEAEGIFQELRGEGKLVSGRRLALKEYHGLKVPWLLEGSLGVKQREQESFYDIAWYPEKEEGESESYLTFRPPFVQEYPFGEIRMNVYDDSIEPLESYYPPTSGLEGSEAEEDLGQVAEMIDDLQD